jgi:uncharacterized protein YcbK (DUF882 family)
MKLTEHFTLEEFRCRCGCGCEKDWIDECRKTAEILEELRTVIGNKPITITCGVRCPKHNANVGGKPHSKHLSTDYQGAADTFVPDMPAEIWARAAFRKFPGCILYTKKHFVHVDRRRNESYYAIDGKNVDNFEEA